MANIGAFYETRNLFISYTGYIKPLTFEQWKAVPTDQKSAVLFVQFFEQVCMAWNKANRFDVIPSEDGVSTVMQYLEKNVQKILDQPQRFSPSYIYTVAYNCMYCILEGERLQKRLSEVSNVVSYDGEELDLFDSIESTRQKSAEEDFELQNAGDRIWAVIEDMGLEAEKVANYLLSGDVKDLKKVSKRSKNYVNDHLRDVEVSVESLEAIVEELREKLASIHEEMKN